MQDIYLWCPLLFRGPPTFFILESPLNLTTTNTHLPRHVVQGPATKVISPKQSVEVCLPEITP